MKAEPVAASQAVSHRRLAHFGPAGPAPKGPPGPLWARAPHSSLHWSPPPLSGGLESPATQAVTLQPPPLSCQGPQARSDPSSPAGEAAPVLGTGTDMGLRSRGRSLPWLWGPQATPSLPRVSPPLCPQGPAPSPGAGRSQWPGRLLWPPSCARGARRPAQTWCHYGRTRITAAGRTATKQAGGRLGQAFPQAALPRLPGPSLSPSPSFSVGSQEEREHSGRGSGAEALPGPPGPGGRQGRGVPWPGEAYR